MEDSFRNALHSSVHEFLSFVASHPSRPYRSSLKSFLHSFSKKSALDLSSTLADFAQSQVLALQHLHHDPLDGFKTPSPPKRKRRRRIAANSPPDAAQNCHDDPPKSAGKRSFVLANFRACSTIACFGLSHPLKAFQPSDLFPTVQTLHDQLVLFEDDIQLQDSIASLCETWWRDNLPGRESLIAQSLPYLLSKSLEVSSKVNVHRVYGVREAFCLFDFVDESIEDLKHLLMRCVLTPSYLRSVDGRRFLSFLFGLNAQLTKELVVMVRSQISFGRKSILEAYGEILFRAWRTVTGPCLDEIESCIQYLIESAIYASTKTLASSIRKVLGGFTAQRTQDGVEALLFRLQEPILFRSLQVANSNIRRNALLLLVDMFPLEDPDASKEENDILLDRQFIFLEKLLADPCPDVRITAVEGVCRVLRLFWEVVSSATTVKLLSKIVDETARDKSSTAVRCAVVQGMIYVLENPASHELLKVLLPRLGPLLNDCNLAVRIAMADMLLAIKGIRAIPFLKVVSMESLLSVLALDKPPVSSRITRLLIPSYFPSKVPLAEACNRCSALIKRSPQAGARFCEYALAEGISPESLLQLVKVFIGSLSSSVGSDAQEQEGIFLALSKLCHSLAGQKELKVVLGELLTRETLKSLLNNAAISASRTLIMQLVSVTTLKDVPEVFEYCWQLVTRLTGDTLSSVSCQELRAVHSLMLAWGGFDELIQALLGLLTQHSFRSEDTCKTKVQPSKRNKNRAKSCKSPWTKFMQTTQEAQKGRKNINGSLPCPSMGVVTSAIGAAWHVENLLELDETRKALLAHENLSSVVFGLRNTVQSLMHGSSNFPISDFLMTSPIRAYTAITIHMALQEKVVLNITSGTRGEPVDQDGAIVEFCKELVGWTSGLQSCSLPCSPLTNVKSKKKKSTGVPVELRRLQSRAPFSDISNTPCGSTANGLSEEEKFLSRVKISNTTLESLLHVYSLNLVKDITVQDVCLEFTSKLVHWIILWLRARDGQQMELLKKNAGNTFKDLLLCVRSTAAHAAKMLYLSLRNDTERALHFGDIANDLLDLIVCSDSLFGLKGAMSFLTALRPWVPDLLISAASSPTALTIAEGKDGMSDYTFDELVGFGKRVHRLWVARFAITACQSMEAVQNSHECSHVAEETNDLPVPVQEVLKGGAGSLFAQQFLKRVSKLLWMGNQTVLEGMLTLFLWHTAFSLGDHDYNGAVGALDIVCRRFLQCKLPSKKGLKITLSGSVIAACEEISGHLEKLFQSISSTQSERNNLHVAKELADTLLLLYKVA